MFLGTYSPRMDAKGRIILPAKFREELSAGLVLTRGQERCLYVFPSAEFERIHERMRSAPLPGRAARDFLRVFLSGASDELPDKQGRITIPPILRQYAGLGDQLVVIGSGTARKSGTPPPGRSTWPARKPSSRPWMKTPSAPCSNDSTARRIGRDTETTGTPSRQGGKSVRTRCAVCAPTRFIDTPLTTTQDYLTQEHP